jgi:hypothetical protein
MAFRIEEYKGLLIRPELIVQDSHWNEHIPFAQFLIEILRPRLFVELGVFKGGSYNAFCQAVKKLKTATKCFGVDNWTGDRHNGTYDLSVYSKLLEYQMKHYKEFSELLKMNFDEALPRFADGKIDLLHIDGYHTYDAVKHDYECWLPKMSDKGVILFHDTAFKNLDFGVWKLWEEVSALYPSLEFEHGNGLGVLAVGGKVNDDFKEFLAQANKDGYYKKLFYNLGGLVSGHEQFAEDVRQKEETQDGAGEHGIPAVTKENFARLIAFYLPQFYPIPENDKWWGKGFTEWTNVAKARPVFRGHYQPRLPADLGFYDLRDPMVREEQAELAKKHGIYGFCYYHYWTKGKMVLDLPLKEVVSSGRPDFPFCVCWGNHNWTRRWDGLEDDLLLKQDYSFEDDLEHINRLIPMFRDKRYIKINGRPLFIVHLAQWMPDPEKTAKIWREAVKKAGFPGLYLVNVENNYMNGEYRLAKGFDASIEFSPDLRYSGEPLSEDPGAREISDGDLMRIGFSQNRVYLYDDLARNTLAKKDALYTRFCGVCPSWDNSPRRGKLNGASIYHGSTPDKYREFLERTILYTYWRYAGEERLIFINAWNEWGEGCYLEPDRKFGSGYLEATKKALDNTSAYTPSDKAMSAFEKYEYCHLVESEKSFMEKYAGSADLDDGVQDIHFYAQAFIDTGEGFSEEGSIKKYYQVGADGKVEIEFDISCFKNIENIRFDPITDQISALKLDHARLACADGTEQTLEEGTTNASYGDGGEYVFRTGDPQIFFEGKPAKPPLKLKIGLQFKAIGEETYSYIIKHQDRSLAKLKKRLSGGIMSRLVRSVKSRITIL